MPVAEAEEVGEGEAPAGRLEVALELAVRLTVAVAEPLGLSVLGGVTEAVGLGSPAMPTSSTESMRIVPLVP